MELTPFKRVIGIDPSEKMVEQARLALPQNGINQIEFAQGSAEDLSMLPDSSADLVIAGLFAQVSERRANRSPCNVQHRPLIGSIGISYGRNLLGF
jgi:SAM-dependent methyltransferase